MATNHPAGCSCGSPDCPEFERAANNFGDLKEYSSARQLRPATKAERDASRAAAESDGGAGVIEVDGVSCYVEE